MRWRATVVLQTENESGGFQAESDSGGIKMEICGDSL